MSRTESQHARTYRMRRRAEQIDHTRRRIVEATVALHGSVGPAGTTFMGIAERAGVTRATVYRHFPDEVSLFTACSAHWFALQQPPNPAAWATVRDPLERVHAGLTDLYRFYRAGEPMLSRIHRDLDIVPQQHRRELRAPVRPSRMAGGRDQSLSPDSTTWRLIDARPSLCTVASLTPWCARTPPPLQPSR